MVDTDTLAAYTLEQMKDGNNTISLTDADCYLQPEITSDDLQDKLAEYNRFSDLTITYDFDDRQEVLDTRHDCGLDYNRYRRKKMILWKWIGMRSPGMGE